MATKFKKGFPETFEAYLSLNKIDSRAFKVQEPELWKKYKADFEKSSRHGFDLAVKFLLNPWRKSFPPASI